MIETYQELITEVKALPYIHIEPYTLEWNEAFNDVCDLLIDCDYNVAHYWDCEMIWVLITDNGELQFDYHQPECGGTAIVAEEYLLIEAGRVTKNDDYNKYMKDVENMKQRLVESNDNGG